MDKTVVELFAGVGGFRCGLNHVDLVDGQTVEDETWDFVWANQWEPSTKSQAAFDCYVKRFGESENHVNEDISNVDKNTIPDHTLLVGGFPCQDYSVARSLSNEKGIEGKKGVLWWQIAEVLEAKQPPFVLLENVDRLLRSPSTQRGRDFGIMLRTFHDNDYSVEWRVINAADYGFPQKRRRVFIFAYKNSTSYAEKMSQIPDREFIFEKGLFAELFPIEDEIFDSSQGNIDEESFNDLVDVSDKFDLHFFNAGRMKGGKIQTYKVKADCDELTTLYEVLEDNPVDEKYYLDDDKFERIRYLKSSKKLERKKPNGETYCYSEGAVPFPDKLDVPARTMLTSETTVNRSTHVVEDKCSGMYRILTPIEAEKINMFPENWTNIPDRSMTEKRRYFLMGNALVVGIVERIGNYLNEIIDRE
ncbi:MAG: DNA (cytosine-5-)-methyltransferase [Methanobrevibacter sp.]|uniref:DNA (cytosine-5-)-methyltransferase n=1 Tax=Methanobrevibacter sp. TaxID=66852 RepID=UPI0026DEFD32|nr:DNA (cytosine-5-)-methyltransferase [Methanobrevibacter sp.]MDO5848516.1 DNA (cytosine-5-)-methyltransferase [Methanobrevibacter sp.]